MLVALSSPILFWFLLGDGEANTHKNKFNPSLAKLFCTDICTHIPYFLNPLLRPRNSKFCMLLEGSLQISEKLRQMKYLLFGYHDNWPMNKYFLLIFCPKTTSFLNIHKNYSCKVSTCKLSEMIALFMLNLINQCSVRREGPIFEGTGGKIGLKLERLQIPGY